jgi:hypothetical protein
MNRKNAAAMPKPKLTKIPGFRSEAEERALRSANEQDVPYQSLMKVYLAARPKARGRAKAK